ncbi:MAG: response regulator [Rhodobacteraceae bacterium]|nr:MAG: response regulator [Paracoccaceae bacterium]
MPESLVDLMMTRPPTPEQPLLGVMILLVEDSRLSCEAMRLICQRSGARIRRAESLASAERHLRSYRPRVAIVDLGLPDGSGLTLISQLARSEPRIEAIIAVSGDDTRAAAAMEAGADIFLPKPLSSISAFQSTVLGLLPAGSRPQRLARPLEDDVAPDPIALKNDLSLAAELLASAVDAETIIYLTGFLSSLARDADDTALEEIAGRVAEIDPGDGGAARQGRVAAMIRARIDTLDGI